MGLLNWTIHRSMRRHAEEIVQWIVNTYQQLRTDHPVLPERDILAKLLDQRGRFPRGDTDRDIVLDRYGSSLNGLCYYLGLNSQLMKGMMISRCVQYTEYIDTALKKLGFGKPPDETKLGYFKTLGLPEGAVAESYL